MSNGWWGTELYRGAIYVPVREDLIAASLGSGEYYELGEATQVEEDWAQTQKV
jgi:fructose-1,6-bisphosphatase/inositol monophosphatase family enzyme